MDAMNDPIAIALVAAVVVLVAAVAAVATWAVARRQLTSAPAVDHDEVEMRTRLAVSEAVGGAVRSVLDDLRAIAGRDRDEAITAALHQSAVLGREQFAAAAASQAADLGAKKDLIEQNLGAVRAEVRQELDRLGSIVRQLSERSAEKFGEVDKSLQVHSEVAAALATSTRALSEALSNPQARGQWGERMAEDVLRLAGLVEGVNYVKQAQLQGGTGRPDYTFTLPKGHQLYMDVKFPMASYLRYLEAASDGDRRAHLKQFLTDVRARVKELAKRDYSRESASSSVDYVLLFMPNEQLTSFIVENDPALLDDALGDRVVVCSPLTLFAFLGVIRQAFDAFVLEQTSDEILKLIGGFSKEWDKYTASANKVKSRFDSVAREFDSLVGTRRRALERPLRHLEDLRRQRNLPIEGQLFADADELEDDQTDNVRQLGA